MGGNEYRFAGHRLAPGARELRRDDALVALPRRAFDALVYLIEHRERAVGRDELVAAIWNRVDVSDVQLGQTILRARRAVGDDGLAQTCIRTVPGFGYRFVAPVECVELDDRVDMAPTRASAASAAPPIEPRGPFDFASQRPAAGSAPVSTMPAMVTSAPAPARGAPHAPAAPASPDAEASAAPALPFDRTTRTPNRPRRRRIAWAVASIGLAAAIATAVVWLDRRAERTAALAKAASSPVAVLPVDLDGAPGDEWVRLGTMDLIADRLRAGGVAAAPSENVLAMLQALPADVRNADDATLARALGTGTLVRAKARREGAHWRFELDAVGADGARMPAQVDDADALVAARGVADSLLASLGHAAPEDGRRDWDAQEALRRARAAMLANEIDAARAILLGAPALARAPAQLRYRLAQVDFRAGRLDEADASLGEVLASPEATADASFRASVLTARGTTRVRRGDFARGGEDFDAALRALGADDRSLERGQALAGRGLARIAALRFDDALADLGAARALVEGGGDLLGVARIDANLGMLELYRGRPSEALGYLPAAADRLQAFGALHELMIALSGQLDAELQLLQRDAAWRTSERSWALRQRITDPDQWVDLVLNRAQVLIGFGRYREADALLADPKIDVTPNNRLFRVRALGLRAELAARLDRPAVALARARDALADWPSEGAAGERERIALIAQRAALATGALDGTRALLDRDVAVPTDAPASPGDAIRAIAQAEWFGAHGDAARSEAWFRSGLASAERRGVPLDIAAVAQSYAPTLLARGALAEASAVIGRVAPWAVRDFDCALLRLALFHALNEPAPWSTALEQARALAGERTIPDALTVAPERARAPRAVVLRDATDRDAVADRGALGSAR